ncbi:NAD(P)-binding domain-containing protein [Streptomyces iranensis]|uniref:NADP oxidoreductase coenzyme F420-dependent n=2 Tax=Streptomyces iranensis TaxID=576784 RepID=A0A061AB75_9ACTN|nr:NADP oxidoreductase coenzyme F420-dependent [Streptomyces iranensis]
MSTIGLIGTGKIGSNLARMAVAAGHHVVLSNSRGPESLADLVAELGERASAAPPVEAALAGDLVVVSLPLYALRDVPAAELVGKVIIDTSNYFAERDGTVPELESGAVTVSELLQKHLEKSKVVKCFNNLYYRHMSLLARPSGAPDRTHLTMAGDDAEAKTAAAEFIGSIGYSVVDAGPLAEGWRFELGRLAYAVYTDDTTERDENGIHGPAIRTADEVREALAKATR